MAEIARIVAERYCTSFHQRVYTVEFSDGSCQEIKEYSLRTNSANQALLDGFRNQRRGRFDKQLTDSTAQRRNKRLRTERQRGVKPAEATRSANHVQDKPASAKRCKRQYLCTADVFTKQYEQDERDEPDEQEEPDQQEDRVQPCDTMRLEAEDIQDVQNVEDDDTLDAAPPSPAPPVPVPMDMAADGMDPEIEAREREEEQDITNHADENEHDEKRRADAQHSEQDDGEHMQSVEAYIAFLRDEQRLDLQRSTYSDMPWSVGKEQCNQCFFDEAAKLMREYDKEGVSRDSLAFLLLDGQELRSSRFAVSDYGILPHQIYVPNGTEDHYGQLRTRARYHQTISGINLEPQMLDEMIESWDVRLRPRVVAAWFDHCGSFHKNSNAITRYLETSCPATWSVLGLTFSYRAGCKHKVDYEGQDADRATDFVSQ